MRFPKVTRCMSTDEPVRAVVMEIFPIDERQEGKGNKPCRSCRDPTHRAWYRPAHLAWTTDHYYYLMDNIARGKVAMMNLEARSGLHVEIYTAFRHMWDDPASGSPVAGSVPDI
jgi:hypothetical protein